jgi:hypothetical protein
LRMEPKAPNTDNRSEGLGEELAHLAYHGMSETASNWRRNLWYKSESIPDSDLPESKKRELWWKLDKENIIILHNVSSEVNNSLSAS